MAEETKLFKCTKCGKEKKHKDGIYVLEGTTFCCKACCGDPKTEEYKDKKDNVCEFC